MLTFRRMTPADAAMVEKVERMCFSMPWSRESFWEEAAQEAAYYLLAFDGEELVGYVGVWLLGDEGHITNVAVAPAARGRGVGAALLAALMEIARGRGVRSMTLEVRPSNEAALALYKKFGFRSVGRRPHYYTDNDEDAEILWNTDIEATLASCGASSGKGGEARA
ncbi:ribosomal protein S18-alanine N-acetyltransferase [uncultured Selenomonas sp.]|uniref:ribosomal protein S18-alanine N-acetyltransferase n=1 Tax=uncultured Selenomonas sp. TaxID=159275 RepID=UPI0028DCFE19|nr:ribosomal protein S18-alanine N-acetyltransferase [uncultured Selenomonas sp.]